jgi:L-aspartate oxidase
LPAGEVASTGVHGANRLASNSLLECVVFGKRAAASMLGANRTKVNTREIPDFSIRVPVDASRDRMQIRETSWQYAGIVRDENGLKLGLQTLEDIDQGWEESSNPTIEQMEAASLKVIAALVLQSSLCRKESRGAHFRTDFPTRRDIEFGFHSWTSLRRPVFIASH